MQSNRKVLDFLEGRHYIFSIQKIKAVRKKSTLKPPVREDACRLNIDARCEGIRGEESGR